MTPTPKTSLARLSDGTYRIRSLETKDVLHETFDAEEAKGFAEYESRARGGEGYTVIGEQLDAGLELERTTSQDGVKGEPFFVARITEGERRRLLALFAAGSSAEAQRLLRHILTRDDFSAYVAIRNSRDGVTTQLLISDEAPNPADMAGEAETFDQEGERYRVLGPLNLRTLGRPPVYMSATGSNAEGS